MTPKRCIIAKFISLALVLLLFTLCLTSCNKAPSSRLFSGDEYPSSSIGFDGDFYLELDTRVLYKKVDGEWEVERSAPDVERNVNGINHRGYGDAPENTLCAYRMSKAMGFDMVECDVSFTSDGVAMLLHDDTIDRTSNGSGMLKEMTFSQVRQYDFGSWKGEQFVGEKIPTLEEFLSLCEELDLYPYIEIKGDLSDSEAITLSQIIKNYDIDYALISFSASSLEKLMRLMPTARFGYVAKYSKEDANLAASWREAGYNVFFDCKYSSLKKKDIEYIKSLSLPLEVWTMNSTLQILDMHEYISGVTSDYVNAEILFD